MSDPVGMSFKAKMNNLAKKLGLRPQTVIQNFMFERFLARLAQSSLRENFIVKGGVLISAMIGIEARSTMDMDATVIDLPMTQRSIRHAVARIAAQDVGDDVMITVVGIGRIRIQVEGYGGIRYVVRIEIVAQPHEGARAVANYVRAVADETAVESAGLDGTACAVVLYGGDAASFQYPFKT